MAQTAPQLTRIRIRLKAYDHKHGYQKSARLQKRRRTLRDARAQALD